MSKEVEVYDEETGAYLFSFEMADEHQHGYADGFDGDDEDDEEEFAILDKNGDPLSYPFRTERAPMGFRMR